MSLINCEINLILTWSEDCAAFSTTRATRLKMSDRKPYITVVTLSTKDNAKLLKQLKSSFKRTINWNKYQPKNSPERPNQYLEFLIDSSFQGVNKLFVLSFVNEDNRRVQTGYYLSYFNRENYNIMIDGKTFLISQLKVI